ncbi:hypothetical protein TGAM01_v204672 [Trichoderma gamsii]|uniref:6-methylsalicylic acid synthase n=1 Tax=Trichoderma gamsii TaxID=398673 RepID=A0A2P4ZQX0_9HYPO|nr:hypothetical protein TGAM01_v204672 [Trichoderma gamsii]PON26662.1 hypothetical protein TGAM01_v204672 [Trichoderma gamsii]
MKTFLETNDSQVFEMSEGIAIVGMACRTAGSNTSPEKLWQFLLAKQDGSGERISNAISRDYFIHNVEDFDAAFFSISPKEVEQMDPHQRLGLELSWDALEDAVLNPKSLVGSNTADFIGVDSRLLLKDLPSIEPWRGIGSAPQGVANRVSYHLDFMGPSTVVDAACASSLVAVHLGCRAIQNLQSDVAIVGGENVLLAPAITLMLGKAGALHPEGGGAVIILKRLSRAIADGDNIKAILKGSAVAQDGKTNGIMAPNSKAQELEARQALAQAGTHLQTLNSRVNWAEAGLKVVHETTEWTEEKNQPRRAAVCSYGYGGTVSHAIVEQFIGSYFEIATAIAVNSPLDATRVLFLVSVPQEKRLAKQVRVLAEWLSSPAGKAVILKAFANTLAQCRAHHDYRLAFIADGHEAATTCLQAAAEDKAAIGHYISKGNIVGVSSDPARRTVWVFSGHGAQWRHMGKELLLNTVFRQAIDPLNAIVQSEAGFSILDTLASGDFLELSEGIQILTCVVQIGLSRVLMSRGLVPEAVIGHSADRNARTKRPRGVEYWANNTIGPVFLKSAVNAAADDGYRVFVEVSTHPIVLFSVNETLLDRGLDYGDMATLATTKQNTCLDAAIMELAAELYIKGADMEKYDAKEHILVGQRIIDPSTNVVRYTARLSTATKPFPGKHPLDGTDIIPAAVYLNTFHQTTGALLLSNVNFDVPVSLGSDEPIVSVVVKGEQISVLSAASSPEVGGREIWVNHSSCSWSTIATPEMAAQSKAIDVSMVQKHIVHNSKIELQRLHAVLSDLSAALSEKGTIVVYAAPPAIPTAAQVADAAEEFVCETASISILAADEAKLEAVISRVQTFEAQGAALHTLVLDISLPDAAERLLKAIRVLNVPPVLGVIHAAGILEVSSLVETTRDSFARFLAPKVNGALALHKAFPPRSLDFFIMYSSIRQLVGTVGQASYGSSNASLNALATYRRARGDNTVAIQFTAVRGLGMATSTSFLMTELRSKGITDITAGEAFPRLGAS